jgi:hypothetical protein
VGLRSGALPLDAGYRGMLDGEQQTQSDCVHGTREEEGDHHRAGPEGDRQSGRKCSRLFAADSEVLHNPPLAFVIVRCNPFRLLRFEFQAAMGHAVCDNRSPTARKSLILKWRDGRVVEGARLESASGDPHRATHSHRSP